MGESTADALEIGAEAWPAREIYHLTASLVAPRPIAWVSTLSPQGCANLAPFSFFTVASGAPPIVMFVVEGVKDTLRNIAVSREFVANLASVDLAEQVEISAIEFPPDVSEFEWANLTREPSKTVAPPRVAEAPAALECVLHSIVALGDNTIVIGRVTHFRIASAILVDGRVDAGLFRPLSRLSGRYAALKSEFKVARPTFEELNAPGAPEPSDWILRTAERWF
jgi:flavin reductase (DIM6/NTAB) family NADH-FMN oxidoreductase RutF